MHISTSRVLGCLAVAVAATAGSAVSVPAHAAAAAGERAQNWSVWGGTVGMRWNRELAADLGLSIGAASARHAELSWREHELFDLRQAGSLDFTVRNGNLREFVGGSLQARGGYVIDSPAGRIDLTDFRLVPRTDGSRILDLVGADGKAWFYVDRLMYELIDGNQRLAVRTMDLRISRELAQRLGHAEAADWAIADMQMTTDVARQGIGGTQLATPKWHGQAVPGVPGATYQADLFMSTFSVQYSRCNGCTGEGGIGRVVFTPSSTLRNNVNNGTAAPTVSGDPLGTSSALYAADIPWYGKFSGNFPPYGNDQHPFLIWNLYRLNADGTLDQIGRSGVKHAFLTINVGCLDDPGDGHILGRGCGDTYGTGNNDSSNDLGPRSEIIPALNIWGRCGSIYDTNCDGVANASGNTQYDQRLLVRESQFSGAAQAGATYLFESWYLARQDVNILNSMGTKRVTFTRTGSTWTVGGNDQYKLGPAIDRWVDPAAPGANASSVMLDTAEGHVKVASKATSLGGGLWRYDYAVMNLDFARVQTAGAEPNLRVIRNDGLSSLTVPVGNATVSALSFGDGDLDPLNDWVTTVGNGKVAWGSANRNSTLTWGVMYRFGFVTDRAPTTGTATLEVGARGTPAALDAAGVIVPGGAARGAVAAAGKR